MFSQSAPEQGETWLLNLRNETNRTVEVNVCWRLRGQSFSETATLESGRIKELSRTFPAGDGKTAPEVSLLSWEYRKAD